MGKNKHIIVLHELLKVVENKYGEARVEEYQKEFKALVMMSMNREIICHIIAKQEWYRRVMFLILYPEYILPYLSRIRARDVEDD